MAKELVPKVQKMPEIKDHIAHVGKNYNDALRMGCDFKNEHGEEIERTNKTEGILFAYMKDTTIHYFMSRERYEWWCKGRTYTMDGKKMHSGYEVKE